MSRFQLPDRKLVLTRNDEGGFTATTQFRDGRIVDNLCLHNWSPCECDRRTTQRLIEEFLAEFPDYKL